MQSTRATNAKRYPPSSPTKTSESSAMSPRESAFADDDPAQLSKLDDPSDNKGSGGGGGGGPGGALGKICSLLDLGIQFITRNGNLHHKTPVAPPSDVNELEYVSALHQCSSMAAMREDGSLTAKEIAYFLRSRHGLDVDAEMVRVGVLQNGLTADVDEEDVGGNGGGGGGNGNGGGGEEEDHGGGVMDLVEVTSTLVIPFLLRTKHAPETARALASLGRRGLLAKSNGGGSARKIKRTSSRYLNGDDAADVDILRDCLTHVLEDCTGSDEPKPIDDALVKDVLRGFGEGALAEDQELVDEMVEVATAGGRDLHDSTSSLTTTTPKLDLAAFLGALTSDVDRMYDPGRYERNSTNFADVWFRNGDGDGDGTNTLPSSPANDSGVRFARDVEGGKSNNVDRPAELIEELLRDKFKCCANPNRRATKEHNRDFTKSVIASPTTTTSNGPNVITRLYTGQPFDYTIDNFRTRTHLMVLWSAFVVFWVAYLRYGFADQNICSAGGSVVTCPLIKGIVNQLLMISELVVFGGPYIFLGSIGNSIEGHETHIQMAIGTLLFFLYVAVFYFFDFTIPFWISTEKAVQRFANAALTLGLIVVAMQCVHWIMRVLRQFVPSQEKCYSRYFTFGNVAYETKIKRSGLFKVRRMLRSAHRVHRKIMRDKEVAKEAANERWGESELSESNNADFLSNFGRALNEFVKLESKTTYIGGIRWTWRKMWDGSLFEEEGIWISGRVAMGTVFQILLIFVAPVVYIWAYRNVLPDIIRNFEPEFEDFGTRANVVMGVGVCGAILTSVIVTVLFLPTLVATTFKFRRGAVATLRSENFLHRYRFALDQATLVWGGMFWGVLFSSLSMGLILGGFTWLLVWEVTSAYVLQFIGNLLGLSVVLISKIIVMQIIRFTHYAAFYRRKPFSSNVMTVVMECYAIGISIWFMVARTIKIIVIGALYVGRIDTPLFSNGIGIFGPLELDNWPTVTRKEILIHEAHRHPYLETLGYLYMMQLRCRNGFAKRACSAWRLIFVLSLMPWLHKYRDMTRPEHFGGDDENDEEGGPVSYRSSLFQDTDTRRSFMALAQSHKLQMLSNRNLLDGIAEDDENDSKLVMKASGSERIVQIRQEMKQKEEEMGRLRSELAVLESTTVAKETASGL